MIRSYTSNSDSDVNEIKQFVIDFFTSFQCPLAADGELVIVNLRDELQEYFQADKITLAFHPHHLTDEAELVTHGSFMLNKVCEYLQAYGQGTYAELPNRVGKQGRIPAELKVKNARVIQAAARSESKFCYVFNFRIDYVSDEKIGELFSIGLNWRGEKWQPPAWAGLTSKAQGGEHPPAGQIPSADMHAAYEQATRLAEDHVLRQSVEQEKDILQRLFKQINRLDVFYTEQIEELRGRRSGRGLLEIQDRIDHLRQEFNLKVAEETENHRLRVKVELINYQVWKVPFRKHSLQLVPEGLSDEEPFELTIRRDLFTRELEKIHCTVCGQETRELRLCRQGHLTCDQHTHQCDDCGQWECEQCGIGPCGECKTMVCSACSASCQQCRKRLCGAHQYTCHVSREIVCGDCSSLCHDCLQVTAQAHAEHCAACREAVCEDCVQECSFCYAHVCQDHIFKCDVCGQFFCPSCIRRSAISDKILCRTHAITCSSCQKSFSREEWEINGAECIVSREKICSDCVQICDQCGHPVSAKHAVQCAACDKTYCENHAVTCHVCQEVLCLEHHHHCQGCAKSTCEEHYRSCSICREDFCTRCLDDKGRCPYCRDLKFVISISLPVLIKKADLPPAIKKCSNWRRSVSPNHEIYLGFQAKQAYIVVFDKEGQLIRHRQESVVDIMKIMMQVS